MKLKRSFVYLSLATGVLVAGLSIVPPQFGQTGGVSSLQPSAPKPGQNGQTEVIQEFPTQGPMQTAWKVRWREQRGPGLIIQDAFFKRNPNDPWIQIIGEARLSEAFVPYHRGSPRFWDVSYNFPLCIVTQADAGAHGQLLRSQPGNAPTVVKEVRDLGVAFKDAAGMRRGEGLVLWGTLSAANYRYVIEYTFKDDGTIQFRCGSTGHNYPGSEFVAHTHNALWRVDVNLGGADHNTVMLCQHIEPDPNGQKSQAYSLVTPFNDGKEGAADFDAAKFTMLRVVNTEKKNAQGKNWSYDLMPSRSGNSRHYFEPREDCTHHDFWVTKNRPGEVKYFKVQDYIKNGEDIRDTDVVLWYSAPGHHEPRSEDGEMRRTGNGGQRFQGATPIMWTSFELRPRDFWDRSPFFPYRDQ
jgi:hypothetical protein